MTVRIAVVGVGSMGKNHARVYREIPSAELVAVVDQNPAVAEQIGKLYRVPYYTDLHEMVNREHPEAASVVVPTQSHYQVTTELLELGCHVLVEKPIAPTLEEAHRMISTAERLGKFLSVGHIERFNPAIIELKKRLRNNELGKIFQIHARRLSPFPTRINDVGIIMDLGIHDLDIMKYLIDSEVDRVYSEAKCILKHNCEDLFIGTLRFKNNTIGLLEINWLTPAKIRELYVTGERGMYKVNYITQDLVFYENAEASETGWSTLHLLRGVSEGAIIQYAIKKIEPLRAELEAFVASLNGAATAITNCYDATQALQLVLMLADSARIGGVQEVKSNGSARDTRIDGTDQTQPTLQPDQLSAIPTH